MRKNNTNSNSQSGLFNPRVLLAFALCSVGVFLAALGFAAPPTPAGWSLITSPNPSAVINELKDVTCASASDCWAVGDYWPGGQEAVHTLIEHWNGSSWTVVPSPNTAPYNTFLDGVACASASDCWAVGRYYHANGPLDTYYQAVIQHWDGTSWTIVSYPAQTSALSDVTCVSASDCWAVGSNFQHWDGTSWTIVSAPPGAKSVSCPSTSECWATNGGIIERWDGSAWTIIPAADAGEEFVNFWAITCAAGSDCWIVGDHYSGDQEQAEPLIEHWNGSAWAFVASPSPGPGSGGLVGVTCVSASDCWAVGSMIQHWDGTSWAIVTAPSGALNVTCASASECWAVGFTSANKTLIEEYAPTIPPLASVVSRKVHGSAGTFDINLPLTGTRGIECRSGGPNGNYQMVFSFVNNLTSCSSASTGSLSSGPGPNQCTVNLTGVANQQNITVTLSNVLDSQNNTGNVAATMGVLIGDTTANGSVNASDISQTKSQSGKAATASNFREDVTVSGSINSSDISLVKSKSGTGLP